MVNTIDTSLLLSEYQESKNKTISTTLGKDDFLKLLMTQLQNQDPTNPMEDTEFISQMAQFSTLEQMTNMTSSIDNLVKQVQQNQLIAYNQFIGEEVTWKKPVVLEDGTTKINEGVGKVAGIQYKDDSALFILEDGTELEPQNITQVNGAVDESNIMQASMMIGKTVTYENDENEEETGVVKSVSFKSGNTTFQLDDEANTDLTSSQIIKIS